MIVDRIYQHYERQREVEPPRFHLGASQLGADCERAVWMSYRWFDNEEFEGTKLRLFDTGKREEFRFLEELEAIGVELNFIDNNPELQHRISAYGGHFAGSLDAIATRVDPENPETPYVIEFKTHNTKSFNALKKEGVQQSKWQHYVQVQIYMGITSIHQALYLAVHKDTDELYEEIISFDKAVFEQMMQKARRLIHSQTAPFKINESPQYYKCKWCPMSNVCHKGAAPKKSCRSCVYAKPHETGKWHCSKKDELLDNQQQLTGCDDYTAITLEEHND